MKIQINTTKFQSIIKKFKNVKLNKLDMDSQKSMLIVANDDIKMYINNLHVQMEATIPGTVLESGMVCIPEETLKILEHFKDDLLTIDDNHIIHETRELKFMPAPADEYHYFNELVEQDVFTLTEKELTELLTVSYATSKDNSRPIYEGILISDSQFTALDEYRLASRTGDFYTKDKFVISKNTWEVLKRTSKKNDNPVIVYKTDDFVKFEFEDVAVIGKLLHGQYLDTKKLINVKPELTINVNGNDVVNSMKIIDKLKAETMRLTIQDDVMKLEAKTGSNVLIEQVPCNSQSKEFEMFLNPKLFNDAVKQYKGDEVTIKLTQKYNPLIMESGDKIELVLPMRVDNYEI